MNIKAKSIKIVFDNSSEDSWESTCENGIEFTDAMHIITRAWAEHDKPKEPLIESEDVRDAVRLWASTLQIREVRCKKRMKGVEVITLEAFKLGSAPRIEFADWSIDANVTDGAIYTIAELCGESKEDEDEA